MKYFKGFEDLSKEFRSRIPKVYDSLLQGFGELKFEHKDKEECFCHKRNNTLRGNWKIYFKKADLKDGFVLYFETYKLNGALEYKIGEFNNIEELKEMLTTKKTKEIIAKGLLCQITNS